MLPNRNIRTIAAPWEDLLYLEIVIALPLSGPPTVLKDYIQVVLPDNNVAAEAGFE